MVQALRQTVTIRQPGHLEISSPELRAGDVAEVIVLVQAPPSAAIDPIAALDQLQRSMKLTPERAQEWIDEVNAERAASGPRGLE